MSTVISGHLTTNRPTYSHYLQQKDKQYRATSKSSKEKHSDPEYLFVSRPQLHGNHPYLDAFYRDKDKQNLQKKSNQQARYQKLQELQLMKRSQLDQLNNKVKSLIDKISNEESPINSFIKEHPTRDHLKTDHLSYGDSTMLSYGQHHSRITLSDVLSDSQEMNQSTLNKPVVIPQSIFKIRNQQEDQLEKIRNKYKGSSYQQGTLSARLRTESKVQTNRKKNRLTTEYSDIKENIESITIHLGSKRDIRQDIDNYQKKVDKYNQKRENLLKQCNKKTIPLQENISHFNHQNTYVLGQFEEQEKKINSLFESNFFDHIVCSDSGLPTADFRFRQDSNELQTLLDNLISQVKLDSEFRQAKKWFKNLKLPSKWKLLTQILKQNSIYYHEDSIHEIFELQEQEDCPFYTPRQTDYTIQQMVHLFMNCQQNWISSISKQYSALNLQFNGLKEDRLDTNDKGFISISDLIRFINTEKDVQFRSRDLHLIYQRLKNHKKLYYEDLMEAICN